MDMGMKILCSLILVIYFLEEFEAGDLEITGKDIYTDTPGICQNVSLTELVCNLTDSDMKYILHVTRMETTASLTLKIIGADKVTLNDSPVNYNEIIIENCKDLRAETKIYSSYKLELINSNASVINESVNYFKSSKNCHIKTLELRNASEFDIVESEIGTIKATSTSRTPSIISSNINMLDLEISGDSFLNITNSNIQMVRKLNYASLKDSICENSTLQTNKKDSIQISNGKMTFRNSKFSVVPQSFIIKTGTLVFDNITSGMSSDNVILEPDGSFLLRLQDSERVFTMNFKIEEEFNKSENNERFFPLRKVMLKDNTLLISLSFLGLMLLVLILIITSYVIYKKYRHHESDSSHKKDLDHFMLNNENEESDKSKGREYVVKADINNDIQPNVKTEYDKPREQKSYVYSDSQIPLGQNVSVPNQKTNVMIKIDKNVLEEEIEEYSDINIPGQDLGLYSEPELPGFLDNEEIYSDNELVQKPGYNAVTHSGSDKFCSNDIYSENSYPSVNVNVNELKSKLNNIGLNPVQLKNSYQRPNQININSGKGNNPSKLSAKPTNTNYNPNSESGKQNVPNVSFLSRNKDQLRKEEPPSIPSVPKPISKHFAMNKSHPPTPYPKPTLNQTKLPVQFVEEEEEEENFYEEYIES